MQAILSSISSSPVLAALGALLLLVIVIAPVGLKVAGLSGAQIVAVIKLTAETAVKLVRAFRCQDDLEPPSGMRL